MKKLTDLEYYNELLRDVEPKYSYKSGEDIDNFQKSGKNQNYISP